MNNISNNNENVNTLDENKLNEVKIVAESKEEAVVKPETTTEKKSEEVTEKAKCDKKSEISFQLLYVKKYKNSPFYAKKTHESTSYLYKWNGDHWERWHEHHAETDAWNWLCANLPKVATDKTAKSCVNSLKLALKEVPKESNKTIIPLKGGWIVLDEITNTLEVIKPDPKIFIDYALDIHISSVKAGIKKVNGKLIYTPNNEMPEKSFFKKFIESSLSNTEIRGLNQEYCGYTLMKGNPHQTAQVWEGNGSNGKSVLMAIMMKLHQHHTTLDLDNLTPTELYRLVGVSLVVSPESPRGLIHEQQLKKCLTNDALNVRSLYENGVKYVSTAKWIISCNTFPVVQDDTDGVWRRLQIIKWDKQFFGDEIIRDLDKIIIENELHIVLDWCLTGLMRLIKRNGFDTRCVDGNKTEKQISNDNVLSFINQKSLAINKDVNDYSTPKGDIYSDYRFYCEVNGLVPCSAPKFWTRIKNKIKAMDYKQVRIGADRVNYTNISYQPFDNEPGDKPTNVNSITVKELKIEDSKATKDDGKNKTTSSYFTPKNEIKEPKELKVYVLDGKEYTFYPSYIKALEAKGLTIDDIHPKPKFTSEFDDELEELELASDTATIESSPITNFDWLTN